MSETGDLIADTTRRIFSDLGDPQTIIALGDDSWRGPLWAALEESGLTRAWLAEEYGGTGIGVDDCFTLLRVAGNHAVAVPLAETLLAGWLLTKAGLDPPLGQLALAPMREQDVLTITGDGVLSGVAHAVAFAPECDHLAVLADGPDGPVAALVAMADCQLTVGQSMARDALAEVNLSGVRPQAMAALEAGEDVRFQQLAAAARAAQMAGALESLLEMSVNYSQERIAFGRPIAKFQAVQHNLACLAGETAAAVAISTSAGHALENRGEDRQALFIECAAAKIRVGEAAGEGAAIAHQVHGAIGFTAEHVLHRYAQRLWVWRDDFGSEAQWALRLGREFATPGGGAMWPALTAT